MPDLPDLQAAVDKLQNTHSREKERIETFMRMVNEHHATQDAAIRRKDEALLAAKAYLEWEFENAQEFPDANTCNPLLIDQITAALEETNG